MHVCVHVAGGGEPSQEFKLWTVNSLVFKCPKHLVRGNSFSQWIVKFNIHSLINVFYLISFSKYNHLFLKLSEDAQLFLIREKKKQVRTKTGDKGEKKKWGERERKKKEKKKREVGRELVHLQNSWIFLTIYKIKGIFTQLNT